MTTGTPGTPGTHDDRDYCDRYHKGADTSADAFHKTPDKVRAAQRLSILKIIDAAGPDGMTSDEVEQKLSMPHQSVAARMSELLYQGLVKDSGRRRKTRHGRNARVVVYDDPLVKRKPEGAADLPPPPVAPPPPNAGVQKELF